MTLLERIKAATGPDRELDHTIEARLREHVGNMSFGIYKTADEWLPIAIKRNFNTPHYTSSVDAALALMERCLPDARPALFQRKDEKWFARLDFFSISVSSGEDNATTLPLAILVALLSALGDV